MRDAMKVFLTFDVEIWCNGWDNLDGEFPRCFERYIYGRSRRGEYALPKTLEILERNGLRGVFFVEPLFALRFGLEYLQRIVGLIQSAGQEVQLHLHPEWTDESPEPIIEYCAVKRQHLFHYTLDEQTALIAQGARMLEAAGAGKPSAFRAGGYAANRDTFEALRRNHIPIDSSINRCHAVSVPDLGPDRERPTPFDIGGVRAFPVAVFRDGFGGLRPAQVGACGFGEMRTALLRAFELGWPGFVIVSHNFEMLKPDSNAPDAIVVRRFKKLCAFLAGHRAQFDTGSFEVGGIPAPTVLLPNVGRYATLRRYAEQGWRRFA